ncbi:hypothetical protein ITP53_54235 [Nonomuraea sp. K274]|uniref:LGFP repeat-containing protein n=1 Tax=Nonomuraea cypriaca TaxID=1187855 RepID=A0A931AK18_9ACTN|nr:hypothetical protein [Nonomuraea cypriaca]MBF8194472.1 hypothetical protein [Nonomuraea cypriaca]
MDRRIYFSMTATFALSAALVGLPAHAGSAATATATSTTTFTACNPKYKPYGLIGDKWRAAGGEDSVFGCPARTEYGFTTNKSRRQDFRNGQIAWVPALGPKMLVRTYESGGKAVFQWGPTGRDWDYFEVRYSFDNGEFWRYKVKRRDPWNGGFSISSAGPGPDPTVCISSDGGSCGKNHHYFSVRGCDRTGVFQTKTECSKWSLPGRLITPS